MKKTKSPRKVLHIISQAHLDPVWLWPLEDGIGEVLTTMQSAVDRAAETPSFRFTRSSACTYRWVEERDPVLFHSISDLVKERRWEVVGGWIEQPDCNLPSTESFLRQGLYGKAWLRGAFGARSDTRIGYNVDSFGHAGGLPQILRATGFDRYVFMRPQPHDDPTLPLLFWWKSDDGSRVLAQRIPILYSQSYAATPDDIEAVVRQAEAECFAPGFRHGVMWFGVGNHGGGPTRAHVAKILELSGDPDLPELRFSTLRDYFAAVEKDPAFASLPEFDRELNCLFRGCYSSTGAVKRLNRSGEKALFRAESLMLQSGAADPAELGEAWWHLLFTQFHDILAGTCVAATDEDTRSRYGLVLTKAKESALRAAHRMARSVDTRDEKGSVLFVANPLPWARTAVVELDTFRKPHGTDEITHLETQAGERIPLQWVRPESNLGPWGLPWAKLTAAVPLPAGGYRVFRVVTRRGTEGFVNPFAGKATSEQFVKTEDAESQVVISREPSLDSMTIAKREYLRAPVGLVVIRDTSGAWGHGVEAYRDEIGRPESLGREVLEDGPVVRITRETFRWEQSEIWLDVVRPAHTRAIELRLRVNWQEKRQMLKLEIPTRLKKATVRAKMPGEVATRAPEGREEPCHDWVALEGTLGRTPACVAVVNDSTYAYDVLNGVLRLTLVRAVPAAEHPPFEYKDDRHVRFLDQGWQERRFWILAGEGERRDLHVDRFAEECQQPPVSMLDSGHPGTAPWEASVLSMETPGIQVLACKPAENGKGMILRLQEVHGKTARASGLWQGKAFSQDLRPWEIRSLRLRIVRGKLETTRVDALEKPATR